MFEWPDQEATIISGERRSRPRYALAMPLEYRALGDGPVVAGSGTTRDLSSLGIAFHAGEKLPPGTHVEVSIEWPSLVGSIHPPRLVARGVVLRSADGVAAIRVTRMQFTTTRSMAAGQMPALP